MISYHKTASLIAGVALTLFAATAQAQYKTVHEDGIAASPRTRAQINELKRTPAAVRIESQRAHCPACKDQVSQKVDQTVRGVNKPVSLIVKHLCQSCTSKTTTIGHGKTRQTVRSHGCSAVTSVCCAKPVKG